MYMKKSRKNKRVISSKVNIVVNLWEEGRGLQLGRNNIKDIVRLIGRILNIVNIIKLKLLNVRGSRIKAQIKELIFETSKETSSFINGGKSVFKKLRM